MRKIFKAVVPAAIAVAAVCLMSGCSKTTAETSAAETETSAAEETTAYVSADQQAINALDPQRPEDMGKITIGDLSTVSITAPLAQEVTEADVDTYISDYIISYETVEVDEPIQTGYTANIDFTGKIDGVAFDGGTASGYSLKIGSGSFIEGFEDGLVGASAGETRSLNLKFPDDYASTDVAGKDVVFDVTVNSVSRPMTLDDFSDDLANTYSSGEYPTVAEYRAGVREALEQTASALVKGELFMNAIDEAEKVCEAEIGDDVTEWVIDLYLQNYDKTLLTTYGYRLSDMLTMYQTGYDDYRSSLRETAADTAKQQAIIYEIAKNQGIEYNDESLQKYLDEYGYSEDLVKSSTTDAWLENTVIQYMVSKYIIDQANVTYLPYEEYAALVTAEAEAAAAESVEEVVESESAAEAAAESESAEKAE